jgi:hypothetical protein
MSWPTDRSRFLDGFSCSWKRLLRFHAFDTGIERLSTYAPLATGISIHSALEAVLKAGATTREQVSNLLEAPLRTYREAVAKEAFEDPSIDLGNQLAIVEALAHAYTRITVPWLHENFEIVDVEAGQAVELANGIIWRARPDFVTRMKQRPLQGADLHPGKLAIHDFKSSAYWSDSDADQWKDSLQQMLNAWVASMVYGERVEHYYIHILVKGTKKSPSYLTHPSYRPANPPLVSEEILPYYTAKKGFGRVFAPQIPLLLPDWVWGMEASYVAKAVPVVGPFQVDYAKVERFLAGLPNNEQSWMDRLAGLDWTQWADPTFQTKLDELFPRTFNCYEFGGRKCQFYNLCHHAPGWESPLSLGQYKRRTPHHLIGEEDIVE